MRRRRKRALSMANSSAIIRLLAKAFPAGAVLPQQPCLCWWCSEDAPKNGVDSESETMAAAAQNGLWLLLGHCAAIWPSPLQYKQRPSLSQAARSCSESFFLLALRSIGPGAVTL